MPEDQREITRKYLVRAERSDPEHVSVDWGAPGKRVELSIEIEDGALRENQKQNATSLVICIIREHKRLERSVGRDLDICDVQFERLPRGTYQVYSVVK
jgi:hypothetical protein